MIMYQFRHNKNSVSSKIGEPGNTYESLFLLGNSGHAAVYPSLADRPSTPDLQDSHVSS